jgi:hypothetical protein
LITIFGWKNSAQQPSTPNFRPEDVGLFFYKAAVNLSHLRPADSDRESRPVQWWIWGMKHVSHDGSMVLGEKC